MNRTLRIGLLATSSALAMMVASEGAAFATGCTFQNDNGVGGTLTIGSASDCVTYFDNTNHNVTVINNSTLTAPGTGFIPGTGTGISVLKPGTILNGNITNNGAINASIGVNIGGGATSSTHQNAGAVLNGSITNAGTITAAIGIQVSGSSLGGVITQSTVTGSIINAANGQMQVTNDSISVAFATVGGSITNAGTITSTGSGGISVLDSNLGSSSTPGSGNIVNATGAHMTLTDGFAAIDLNGSSSGATAAGSIINNGTITLQPTGSATVGIEVIEATLLGGVTNGGNGTINAVYGIAVTGKENIVASIAGSIVNQGQINAVATNGSSFGIAIFGFEGGGPAIVGGSIVNSGTISSTGVSGTNAGIFVAGAHIASGITNTNTISVSGAPFNVGIYVAKSSFANFSPANSSIGGSIVNQGAITAGTGILVSGSTVAGNISNTTGGKITAATSGIVVTGGSVIKGGIIVSGTINAGVDAINLGGEGAPTAITIMGGTAAVTGNIVGNGLSAGDTLDFQIGAGNAFTYGSNFSAIQQVNVTSGTVVLNGNANSSSTLNVSGGTLMGTGTIATAMTVSGGAFAPGNATPGTSMNITGSLAFLSGALYVVYLNPSTSSYANVTGTASLAGTVGANFAAGSYMEKQYTILQTTGGISGAFAGLTTNGLPPGFSASLSYNADDAFLDLTAKMGLQQTGLTQNELAVAAAINKYFNTVGSLPPNFANLFNLTGTTLANALTQLDGEDATGAEQGAFTLMNEFLELMQGQGFGGGGGGGGLGFAPDEQTDSLPPELALAYASILKAPPQQTFDQRWSAWASGFGGGSFTDGNAAVGSNNVTTATYGTAAGMQYRVDPDTVLGFALAGAGLNWGLAQGLGTGRSDAFQAGVYGKSTFGPAYLSGALAFGNNWFTTNRTALGDQLTANFSGQSYAARGEAGYRYALPTPSAVVGVTPYAAVQTQWFHTPAYSETDLSGGALGLTYASANANDTRSELGARFDDLTALNGTPLLLRARLAWAHDWTNGAALNAAFESLPGSSFTVNGAPVPLNSALTTASAQYFFTPALSFTAKFDGEFASTSQTYAGSGTLKYTW